MEGPGQRTSGNGQTSGQAGHHGTSVRVAALGDVHCTTRSAGALAPVFQAVNEQADILALCGDLADYGLPEEAQILVRELSVVRVPIVGVLGNHDFESAQQETVKQILCDGGIQILDGDSFEINGVGFAGVKGFGGGFGARTLGSWGEPAIKAFVHEAIEESLKLETALARLRTEHKLVLMHYSPIQATCEGEPLEIMPFLGSSRLEEPINRYPVTAVLHGHAHRGSLEGRTQAGIPVYNVSAPLLRRNFPDRPPFRVIQLPLPSASDLGGSEQAEVQSNVSAAAGQSNGTGARDGAAEGRITQPEVISTAR